MAHDFDTLLRLHPRGDDSFQNEPLVEGHLYGGYTLGLAVRAAARTVAPGLLPTSVHAVFPSGGELGSPLTLGVRAVRDGRSSAVRLVTVTQGRGTPLLLTASFHVGGEGPDWQEALPPLPADPDEIAPDEVRLMGLDPFEYRPAGRFRVDAGADVFSPLHPYWVRPHRPLPADDPGLHAAVIAFVSDYMVFSAAQVPGAPPSPETRGVTMDHTLWFHRPVDAGEWLLYSADPVRVLGDRGLVRGTVRTRDGEVVASFAQEALTFRPRG
ncbi:acyl-CoA thioesterase [Trujillonella endophytica]|uniref:Acyl-CoA thioesterase-2 n=1 Tax=Trujillonella endophytica TaxID=673521 RepID=A0A1H8TEP6_9ACTN|nr:acyl-CoA thioesterase domain-containing protein [Trujillella endophytica]SEO89392.1 acyl-CoA thioesterase-2 [Trujillella endophytica]